MKHPNPHSPQSSSPRLRIYLMRHGETELSAENRLCGHTDVPLSPVGIEQSHRLAVELGPMPLAAVYSSDLSRAVFAAQLIADAHCLIPRLIPDLREANMGDWEARPLAEIAQSDPEMVAELFTDPSGFRYPRGESFADLEARVARAFQYIRQGQIHGEIAIVAHGGVSRVIIGSILELSPKNLLRLCQDFGCINIIDIFDGQPIVRLINYVPGRAGLLHWRTAGPPSDLSLLSPLLI